MRRLPGTLAVALLLSVTIQGCLGSADGADPAPDATGGWHLACDLGDHTTGPWHQPCLVRASYNPASKAETWLKINPVDPSNIVTAVKDNDPAYSDECTWNGVYVTQDSGRSWTEVHIGGTYDQRSPGDPYWGYACNTDPMFAFSPDGTLHYGVEVYSLGIHQEAALAPAPVFPVGWKLLLATSHDGGETWEEPITFHPDKGTVTDYGRMAVSPTTGTILEAINSFETEEPWTCHVVASRDGGQTAEPPVKITPLAPREADLLCTGLAVAPDGTVTVLFRGNQASDRAEQETWLMRSTDDGRTFGDWNPGFTYRMPGSSEALGAEPSFAESEHRIGGSLDIVYDAAGTLWAAYHADVDGQSDVLVRQSTDHGGTWTDPVRAHPPSDHHQYLPNLAAADDGSVHVVFFDRRWDPDNRLNGVTWAHTTDGGATWQDRRVTDVSWDPDLGEHQRGEPFIGDYLGIDTVGDDVWFAVPDTSLGGEPVVAVGHAQREG